MRKVITGAFVSLDGVMQAPGGPHEDPTGGFTHGGWVWPHADEAFGRGVDTLFAEPFDLLLGRKTYEIFAAYWPSYDGGDNAEIARTFNRATKYVATRSDMPLAWETSVRLSDAAADVARLKKEDGPALVTQGSADLIQTLLAHDLIDELHLFTFPITLGRGKRLFAEGAKPAAFEAGEIRVTPKGVIVASYRRAGAVETGDLGEDRPSAAELARREKWKREG